MDSPALQRGVRIGVDVGKARVGLARSDADGLLATPLKTLARSKVPPFKDVQSIIELAQSEPVKVIYVGLPMHLNGSEGQACKDARAFAARLSRALLEVEVRMVDERLTTVSAHQALQAAGMDSRSHRGVVDQVAAVFILQAALDFERSHGVRAGELV